MNAYNKKRNTWVRFSFFFGIMVLIVVIIYLYFFSKSGYVYERKILGEMEDLHGVEFIVTGRLERNEDGYRTLVVAPKDEPPPPLLPSGTTVPTLTEDCHSGEG